MSRTGIIDIGSNSMRLSIIQEFPGGGYSVLDEHKSSPRLSNEITSAGELSARGIRELIQHLREFLSLCEAYRVDQMLTLGTAALRAASNREAIRSEVVRVLGLEMDIISGQEEAGLGYSAVMHTLSVQDAYLVDIGGGSTEVTLVQEGELVATHSFPFGAVTLSQIQATNDTAGRLIWQKYAEDAFAKSPFIHADNTIEIVGIGGTIRNIAQVFQAQQSYPLPLTHNFVMSSAQVHETLAYLTELPLNRRKKVEGLSKDRADLIVPGGAILQALFASTKSGSLRISGRGLRDGAFYSRRLGEIKGPSISVLDTSIISTLRKFGEIEGHAFHVAKLAESLFSAAMEHGLLQPESARILRAAAMLHRIGVHVNYYHYDRHTFYLIVNSSIYGLTHREIILTAAVASYKGRGKMRKLCAPYLGLLREDDLDLASKLGLLVRLAEALDRRHIGCVPEINLRIVGDRFELWLPQDCDAEVEISATLAQGAHIKKVFGKTLMICH